MDQDTLKKPVDLQGLSLALAKTKADYMSKIQSSHSDWNENDSTDPAYIQNRTHYVGETTNTQVWSDTISFDNTNHWEDDLEDYSWTNNLEDGQAYSVVYNGTTYTGNVSYVSLAGCYAIGNLRLGSENYDDTGEPFLIGCAKNNSYITLDLSEEYTGDVSIALTLTITPIHKLDSKFLNGKLITEGIGINSEIFNDVTNNTASGPYSHAEGYQTSAEGNSSHAEGDHTTATGNVSHAEGSNTTASSTDSHAEGYGTTASGNSSHAEGVSTNASDYGSHAEGYGTTASARDSHAEGSNTTASGENSHAEGYYTTAFNSNSHTEGYYTTASNTNSHAEGDNTTASGINSHAEGYYTIASGGRSHVEGSETKALGNSSHAEGGYFTGTSSNDYRLYLTGDANATTYTVGSASSSWNSLINLYINNCEIINEQIDSSTNKITSITLSKTLSSTAISNKVYYLQKGNVASGINAHTEGNFTVARNSDTHAEGYKTIASGKQAHAEGYNTMASGDRSHTEGANTKATSANAHAEGGGTVASNSNSHAEGSATTASGIGSHAEGIHTTTSGDYSHVEGYYTIANHKSQHVFGEYNVEDPSTAFTSSRGTYVEIVGKGVSDSTRSNARTLDWSGNEVLAGKLTVGTGPTENMDVATKQYVDAATAGVSPNLSGLSDTNISSPADGQVLKYDGASSKWVNGDAEDTIYVTITSATENEVTTYSADKTYADLKEAHLENKNIILKYLIYNFYLWSGPKTASSATTFTFGTLVGGNEYYFTINNSNIVTKHTLQAVKSVNGQTGVISLGITDATDTTISSPATGQILTYDGTTSKWVNTTSPYMTASQVNELITAALAEYGDGDTASYGFEDASEVSY